MHRRKRQALLLAVTLLTACKGAYAVDLTLILDPSVPSSSVRDLVVDISNAETFSKTFSGASFSGGRASVIYHPKTTSGTLHFVATVDDGNHTPVARGSVDVLLVDGTVAMATLNLSSLSSQMPDMLGVDSSGVDGTLAGSDLPLDDAAVDMTSTDQASGTCTDGVKNGLETDIDCGGGGCPSCGLGKGCVKASDCQTAACSPSQSGQSLCVTTPCGPCSVATMTGGCTSAIAGTNPKGDCVADGKCKLAACNGMGTCQILMPGTACGGTPSCSGALLVSNACDGTGTCSSITSSCGAYLCASGKCSTSCTADSECSMTARCVAGQCVARPFTSLNVAACADAEGVAVGDFNLDGAPDVAVACPRELTVLYGKGDGVGWTSVPQAPPPGFVRNVVAADFNVDGHVDLATVDENGSQIVFYVNTGSMMFGQGPVIASVSTPLPFGVLDINRDGRPDVVAASYNGAGSQVLVNTGAAGGGIQMAAQVPSRLAGAGSTGLATADLNRDGLPDIIVANSTDGTVTIANGNSASGFTSTASILVGGSPQAVAIDDLNRDGIADFVVANATRDTLNVYFGNANGSYIAGPTLPAPKAPYAVVSADFNGDGKIDLASAGFNSSDVSLFLGTSATSWASAQTFPVQGGPDAMALGDFNLDGRPDIVVGNSIGNGVTFLLNGQPALTMPSLNAKTFPLAPGSRGAGGVAVVDIPFMSMFSDGNPDIVVLDQDSNDVNVLLGTGTTTPQGATHPAMVSVSSPQQALFGAFDRGGRLEVAILNLGSRTITTEVNGELMSSTGVPALSFAAGDLNQDGILDVVVGNVSAPTVTTLYGKGDGSFVVSQTVSTMLASPTLGVALADLNHDGRLDVIAVGGNQVSVVQGLGQGGLGSARVVTLGANAKLQRLVVMDLQNNGNLDVAATDLAGNQVVALLGDGKLGLVPYKNFAVGLAPIAIADGDLNRDGRIDLIVANSSSDNLTLLLGDPSGIPLAITVATGKQPTGVAVGDIDKDGRLDVIASSFADNTVSVFFNTSR